MGISKSVSTVTIINIASSGLSILNVAVIAFFFGTSSDIEIYFAATLLLNTLAAIANNGQVFDILLPVYHRVSAAHSKKQGLQVFATVVNWLLFSSSLMIVFIYLNLPFVVQYIVPGFEDAMKQQVIDMAQWILPLMIVMLWCSFITTYLNAENKFGHVEMVSFICRLASLLCVIVLANFIGIWAMVVALWLELALRFICLFLMAKRIGYSHSFVWKSKYLELKDTLKQVGLAYVFIITGQLYVVVLSAGVSQLPQGLFAMFNYVKRLYERTNRIFLRPVSLVFFTGASQIYSGKDGNVRALMGQALGLFMFVAVPVMLFMLFYGDECLKILLGTQNISDSEIQAGGLLLATFYSVMLITGVVNLYRKVLIAANFAKQFYVTACFCQISAAIAAWAFLPNYGVNGIIYVWLFNAMFTLILLSVLVKYCNGFFIIYPVEKLVKWLTTGILVSVITSFLLTFVEEQYPIFAFGERFSSMIFLGMNAAIFFLLIAIIGAILNISEIRQLFKQLRKIVSGLFHPVP